MIGNLMLALGISICAGAGIMKQNDIARANIQRAYIADVPPTYDESYTDISNGIGATYSQSNGNFYGASFENNVRVFAHLNYSFDFSDLSYNSSQHDSYVHGFYYDDNNSINLYFDESIYQNLGINVNNTIRYQFSDKFVNDAFFNDYYYDSKLLMPYDKFCIAFDMNTPNFANIVFSYNNQKMNFSWNGTSFGYATPNYIRIAVRDLDAENMSSTSFRYRYSTYENTYYKDFIPSDNWSTADLDAVSFVFPLNYFGDGMNWNVNESDLTGACKVSYPYGFFGHNVEISLDLLHMTAKSGSTYYDSGYNAGYNDGYNIGHTEGYNQGLTTGYANGYAEGFNSVTNNQGAIGLFGAIADTPIRFLKQMFSFELFGMNMAAIILSCLSAVVVFGLIKKIWK